VLAHNFIFLRIYVLTFMKTQKHQEDDAEDVGKAGKRKNEMDH
jgi:hypothetical protein